MTGGIKIETNDFVDLKDFENDYQIQKEFPHVIKCKRNGRIVSESIDGGGYVQVHLNRKPFLKHRLIALNFIPNPDNLPCVDHKSRDKLDNRIQNLRWVSYSDNINNISGSNGYTYSFVTELPKNAFEFQHYGKHEFKNYFYYNNVFYLKTINDDEYRILPILKHNGSDVVCCQNTNGKYLNIFIKKFKKLYAVE